MDLTHLWNVFKMTMTPKNLSITAGNRTTALWLCSSLMGWSIIMQWPIHHSHYEFTSSQSFGGLCGATGSCGGLILLDRIPITVDAFVCVLSLAVGFDLQCQSTSWRQRARNMSQASLILRYILWTYKLLLEFNFSYKQDIICSTYVWFSGKRYNLSLRAKPR